MRATPRLPLVLVIVVGAALALAACGGGTGPEPATGEPTTVEGTLTVLGAASLRDALPEVVAAFEDAQPDVEVRLSFDGTATLVTQILEGAPADVLLAADSASVARLAREDAVTGSAATFATNALAIVVEAGNPLGIEDLDDLGGGLRVALCGPEVPCGRYAAAAFERAGLPVPPASEESSVSGVLTKVALGEADAGVAYVTDVATRRDLSGVRLPAAHQVRAPYLAVALRGAANPASAAAFVQFLMSSTAQAVLQDHGFGAP